MANVDKRQNQFTPPTREFYILLSDTKGRISSEYQMIFRGALLQDLPLDHGYATRRLKNCRILTTVHQQPGGCILHCRFLDIARITSARMMLLQALPVDSQRYDAYMDQAVLLYAESLRVGSAVRIKKSGNPSGGMSAVVRYVGPLNKPNETLFGVELTDESDRKCRKGTSDGTFRKIRYFQTEEDCALFVTLNKLIPSSRRASEAALQDCENAPDTLNTKPQLHIRELTEYNSFYNGKMVRCNLNDKWRTGKVVFIYTIGDSSEPHVAVELSLSSELTFAKPWSGLYNDQRIYSPKIGVFTALFQANDVIPTELFPQDESGDDSSVHSSTSNKMPTRTTNARQDKSDCFNLPGKLRGNESERQHVKKRSRQQTQGSYTLEKPPKALVSSRNVAEHKEKDEDLAFVSGHYNEGPRSVISTVKEKFGKVKSKWSNGGKETDSTKATAQFYRQPEVDTLELDVVEEVVNTIYKDWFAVAMKLYLNKEEVNSIREMDQSEKERARHMLNLWQKKPSPYDNLSRLAEACRKCKFTKLANDLDQGLEEELLVKISSSVLPTKVRPLGHSLNLSNAELDEMEHSFPETIPQVRKMLARWRSKQSYNSDKITLLSNALHSCGLRKLELEVARGLDDAILTEFAFHIGQRWKELSTALNMDANDIKDLGDFSLSKQPYQMLMFWRRKQPRSVDVLGALHKGLVSVGLKELANDLVQGVDDELLYRISTMIGDKWKLMAEVLGFTKEELHALEARQTTSEITTIQTMLAKWRERHDYAINRVEHLKKALIAIDLESVSGCLEMTERRQKEDTSSLGIATGDILVGTKHRVVPSSLERPVTRGQLHQVATRIHFEDLARAAHTPAEDVREIRDNYKYDSQRGLQVLDQWERIALDEKRTVHELLGVVSDAGGGASLLDDIMMGSYSPKDQDVKVKEKDKGEDAILKPSSADDNDDQSFGLEVNSMVEVRGFKNHYGVIRWIGVPEEAVKKTLVAGIELETALEHVGSDGSFGKERCFSCDPGKAFFIYLSKCRPDSRFPSQSQTFMATRRQTSQDFGGFASPTVPGMIDPPPQLERKFVGMGKGIQGDQNSCYLDATLFSMFAYNNVFDPLLHRLPGPKDLQLYEEVQTILRESIVNPLRRNGFVRADRILQLREHLDNLGTTKGLMNEEKDPEEFLHTLLCEVFKSSPLLNIRHGGDKEKMVESNIYQIFLDKDDSFIVPTVEQLLLQSFQEHNLKLVEAPTCLMVQMPRFGKEYKMYKRILPSIQLDITNIVEKQPRQCIVCGNLAVLECQACKSDETLQDTVRIKNYCNQCHIRTHKGTKRSDHQSTRLEVTEQFMTSFRSKTLQKYTLEEVDIHRQVLLAPKLMDLFAIICIRTSHYVAFVKAGRETDSEWIFFDSMADRKGDQQGYNIPQITHLKDFQSWITDEQSVGTRKPLTELMERLLGDAYICMYSDLESRKSTYV